MEPLVGIAAVVLGITLIFALAGVVAAAATLIICVLVYAAVVVFSR